MKHGWRALVGIVVVLCIALGAWQLLKHTSSSGTERSIKVAISPYQDIGMVVNLTPMGLEKKYGVKVNLQTLAWEDIVPAIASYGSTVDLGFASLIGYLTKQANLNNGGDDDVIFIYPAYVFKGGGFISFKQDIPVIEKSQITDTKIMKAFFDHRIGAEKNSLFDIMLFRVASAASINPKSIKIINSSLDNSLLAARNGDLDIASAGLTQLTEALRTNGRMVLSMETANFADITGFVTTRRKLKEKRVEVEAFIRMWFDTVDYVLKDPVKNSAYTRSYLDQHGATHYTPEEYATAVANEYFPRSPDEMNKTILSAHGAFSMKEISDTTANFLIANGIVAKPPQLPEPITFPPAQ